MLNRVIRILLCLASGYAMWVIFGKIYGEIPFYAEIKPFELVFSFLIYAFASIIFFHSFLFSLIVGSVGPWRGAVLRFLDYIWYGAAIIAAALLINDIESQFYRERLASLEASMVNDRKFIQTDGIDRLAKACTVVRSSLDKAGEQKFRIAVEDLSLICPATGLRPRLSLLSGECDKRGLVSHENDARFISDVRDDPLEDALNDISVVCTTFYDVDTNRVKAQRLEGYAEANGTLPLQRSGLWLLILASVIGLRLTRTTAEFIDAIRAAR